MPSIGSVERERGALGGLQLPVAFFGEVEQGVEFGAVERTMLGGALISMKSPEPVMATFMSVMAWLSSMYGRSSIGLPLITPTETAETQS